ncbi:putative aldolase-type TIM barrel, pyruvate/phosphoenolpyruvate kinase-like protein [Tanacetum coccineum]
MRLLTTPYAFNEQEAIEMTKAGADIIVAHMGLTTSGSIGAKTTISLDESVILVQAIADAKHKINPDAIVLCHGGIIHIKFTTCRKSFGKQSLYSQLAQLAGLSMLDLFIPVSGEEVRSVHPEVPEHPDSDSG